MKKIIAFYLPQFHVIPENNEWWGDGFTEWTNVRKAKPLYKGHVQPRIPLNENFYCLLDENTQIWQANLAKKYGVYGFCYYHYWFNGKLLLERPMENMLRNSKIDIPFCISWANETWARTWDGREKQILIKQEYGGQTDWENHIQYLLPFFKDKRYILIDGKPVLLLYSACRIKKCKEMVEYWDDRLKQEGFPGIYVLETLNSLEKEHVLENSMGDVVFEPMYTWAHEAKPHDIISKIKRYILHHFQIGKGRKVDGSKIYQFIENRRYNTDRETFAGTYSGWDNSARKGKRGLVFINTTPERFEDNLKKMFERDDIGEYLFVNAWNEWGEGAYLEPDERYNYQYLEAIKNVTSNGL